MKKRFKILATSAVILSFGLVSYLVFLKFNTYLSEQQVKEQKSQELVLAQQKELEGTKQQIKELRKETEEKIRLEAIKNQKAITASKETIQQQITDATNSNGGSSVNLASIIEEWRPRIAHIGCAFLDGSVASGSGVVAIFGSPYPQVLTNRHVIRGKYGDIPPACAVKFPDNEKIFEITNSDDIAVSQTVLSMDAGALNIKDPNNQLKNLVSSQIRFCFPVGFTGKAAIGEPIVILGYPYTGAKYDVTATEGIISGYEGDYYITSAKVEHGNSGGIAILVNKNCYLGIPTYVEVGTSETLARILDINVNGLWK